MACGNIERIREFIQSPAFSEYQYLFTPQVLTCSSIEKVQELIQSDEFKKYPYLFTPSVLAHSNTLKVKMLIHSDEFKNYPELFTSQVLALSSIEKVQKLIRSEEFKEYRDLFTPTVLAMATIEDMKKLLNLDCWQDCRFKNLLATCILARSKSMIKKIPILISLAEKYGIDCQLTTTYFMKTPSQVYAIINYLIERGQREEIREPLFQEGKLHPFFNYPSTELKRRFNVDLKELVKRYPFDKEAVLEEEKIKKCLLMK